jgi:DNA-binding beta-propeller fold protein YncE
MDGLIWRMQPICFAIALSVLLVTSPRAAPARLSGPFTVAPKSMVFPGKVLGVSGETSWPRRLKISVSPKSPTPITIESIAISGRNAGDFAVHQLTNCVGPAVSTGCAVTVTFTPTGLGVRTATLKVTDASGQNVERIALAGRGVKGRLKWEPREISFGRVYPGHSSASIPVVITNPNGAPLNISRISAQSSDFVATHTEACMGTLAPHSSCSFKVSANLSSATAKSRRHSIAAKLEIQDDAAGKLHNITLSALLSGSAPPRQSLTPAAATLAHQILVANTPCNNVTTYSVGASGNAAPTFPQPQLCTPTGIALDASKNIYVTNSGDDGNQSYSVAVYPPGTKGQVAPSAIISGAATGLDVPQGIAVAGGKIYVVNDGSNDDGIDSLTVYAIGNNGNVAPSATISGPDSGINIPAGVAIDSTGKIYVANGGNNTVTVYAAGSNGNVVPSATIRGFSTGLTGPTGIALDSNGKIYVANGGNDTVTVYAVGSNGNATPSATISNGLSDPTGVALDSVNNIYVANGYLGNANVTVYPAGSTGNAAPSAILSNTLDAPAAIALDSTGKIYVADDGGQVGNSDLVVVYASSSVGTPSAIINSEFAGTDNGMSEPNGIALDNAGNIYVTNRSSNSLTTNTSINPAIYSAGTGAIGVPFAASFKTNYFLTPSGIALDSGQNVYLVSGGSGVVQIFSSLNSGLSLLGSLHGDTTQMNNPAGIALDASGNIYVTNDAGDILGDRVTIYPEGSTGNQPPSSVIEGPNTGLAFPGGIAIDLTGNIYVANEATDSVTVYAPGADGNVTPTATISGSNTGLETPSAVAVDSSGLIYVSNEGGFEGDNVSVTVYAAGSTGNATPAVTIAGSATQLARPRGIAIIP